MRRITRRTALRGLALAPLAGTAGAATPLLIFAAASLKTALDEVLGMWHADGGPAASAAYAASSVLARQISFGAPADLFVSASTDWMDHLEHEGRIEPATRQDLLTNRLVLAGHGAAGDPVDLADLPTLLGDGRLAVALVDSVPAGIYAQQALRHLNLWETLAPRLVQADNVRTALAFVARGEVPYAIVYASDALADPGVHVAASFAAESHQPIVYPAALTISAHPGSADLLAFVAGTEARAVFDRHGFGVEP